MKLINLVFQGITAREENYDFGNKAAGCIVLHDGNKKALSDALSFALYGNADPQGYNLPLRVELKFAVEDVEYALTRELVQEESGAVSESVSLYDLNTGDLYGDDKEEIDAYLLERIGLEKEDFLKLLFIDMEATAPIAGDSVTRESYLAERLAELATSEKVLGKYGELKAAEQEVLDYIEGIESVTRDQIKDQQLAVDNDKLALEALRNQIDEVNIEIMHAEKYREELDQYNQAVAKMEVLNAKSEEMAAVADKAARSEAAKEIASVFYKYQETQNALAVIEQEIIESTQELDALEAKVQEGQASEKLLGDEYVAANIRSVELNAKLREIIKEGSVNPASVKIKEIIESYYADSQDEIKELQAKKANIDADYDALTKSCDELYERKLAIRDGADYKKAVQDGAVLEGNIAQAESSLAEANERIEALMKRRAELYEANVDVAAKAKKLGQDVQRLEKEVRSGYATVEEAVNADALYKNTLYTKHLFVSEHEVDLDAVNKKIVAVEASAKGYGEKLEKLSTRKAEVVAHRAKLADKLALLNEKLMEYMSFNRLRDISNDIAYGSRCPVCDGFVAQKKDLPLRDTKALDDQIKAVQAELNKDDDAILAAESTIGQYQAATTVSNQYLASLISTKEGHEAAINGVLKEYNVATIEELFALAQQAIANSNSYLRKVNLYNVKKAQLANATELNDSIVDQINNIDTVSLPKENEVVKALESLIVDTRTAYDQMAGYYNGESAIELLGKLQIVEKEYEAIEQELEANEATLKDVKAEKEAVDARLTALTARTIILEEGGLELTYSDVVTKAYSDLLSAICKEIDTVEATKERTKLRIAGLKKVVAETIAKRDELKEDIIARVAALDSAQDTVALMYGDYETKFEELGIKTVADLESAILSEQELEAVKAKMFAYDEDVAVTQEDVRAYNESINAHIGYYENYENNVQTLASLREQEVNAVLALSNQKAILEDMEYRYEELIDCNKSLAELQSKIKGIEDLKGAIKEGAVIASGLANVIAERANDIVRSASNNRYYLNSGDNGEMVLSINGKGKVRQDKLTKEEKVILPFAVAAAYNEVMVALLAGDLTPAVVVGEDISDKQSLAPIVEYSKGKEIIAIPVAETAFLNAVSKLA